MLSKWKVDSVRKKELVKAVLVGNMRVISVISRTSEKCVTNGTQCDGKLWVFPHAPACISEELLLIYHLISSSIRRG